MKTTFSVLLATAILSSCGGENTSSNVESPGDEKTTKDKALNTGANLLQDNGTHKYEVKEEECVGCNLCQITCPVTDCITMVPQDTGEPYMNWTQDPRNPFREAS